MITAIVNMKTVSEFLSNCDDVVDKTIKTYDFNYNDNDINITFYQYKIKDIVNGKEIVYVISFPVVLWNNVVMSCLLKLNTEAPIGVAKYIVQLEAYREVDMNYRMNLLLTSFRGINMINVLTDKKFISALDNNKYVYSLSRDKLKLYKTLIKAFNYEVNRYTRFYKIKKYCYHSMFNTNIFNMSNIFAFETDNGDKRLHITFNLKKESDNDLYDKYIRGFNFVI